MKITVEDKHIQAGEDGCSFCAVALALNEQAPLPEGCRWVVAPNTFYAALRRRGGGTQFLRVGFTGDSLRRWIQDWDIWHGRRKHGATGPPPGPICFEVLDEVSDMVRRAAA